MLSFVQVRDDLAIALTVHVLPREDGSYSWFGSRHSQVNVVSRSQTLAPANESLATQDWVTWVQ